MIRRKYTVIIEKGSRSYGASVPDLPGCVAAAKTRPAVVRLIREAIGLHLEDLRSQGRPLPRSAVMVSSVEVAV